jgi:outer membrane murein-binding lipoprotein Lpp
MKKIAVVFSLATLLGGTAMAQSAATDASKLDAILTELQDLKARNERLEAEVEYLKSNAKEARKQVANDEATLSTLNSTAMTAANKYTWSGDFRYRHETIDDESVATIRNRDRVRVRFGVAAKVNDFVNVNLRLSTTNTGNDNYRSTNQTLGTGWDRKPVSFDLAYADWKPLPTTQVLLGKMPIPFVTTASYFWDKDITPEGASLKFVHGPFYANVSYFAINERDVGTSTQASQDAELYAAQMGWKQTIGKATWTLGGAYFGVQNVQDRIVSGAQAGCTIDGAFGSGQGTANNAFGNSTYLGTAPQLGSNVACTRLLNDFNLVEALGQVDWFIGKYPVSVFVDYFQNEGIISNVSSSNKQDTAYAAGFMFNRASAPKTWEFGVVYEKNEKDGNFGGFTDSDFGGGVTDTDGFVFKAGFVPLANWTLNGTFFLNDRFIDSNDTVATKSYKRLQLDLNFKY